MNLARHNKNVAKTVHVLTANAKIANVELKQNAVNLNLNNKKEDAVNEIYH